MLSAQYKICELCRDTIKRNLFELCKEHICKKVMKGLEKEKWMHENDVLCINTIILLQKLMSTVYYLHKSLLDEN